MKFGSNKTMLRAASDLSFGTLAGFAGLVLFNTSAVGDGLTGANNPYTGIAQRNVFELSAAVAAAAVVSPKIPPPKITATGIMALFGQWQVLFKVDHPGEAGRPARKVSYILSEGERQDDIEVAHIDHAKGVVTFNNHGVEQDIALMGLPADDMPMPALPSPVLNRHPASFENSRTPDYLGGGANGVPNGEPYQNTTTGQRIILIEAQRAYLKSRNDPAADLLPPTALTPPE